MNKPLRKWSKEKERPRNVTINRAVFTDSRGQRWEYIAVPQPQKGVPCA